MDCMVRISAQTDLATSLQISHSQWYSAYDVKITSPYMPQMTPIQVPMLLVRPTHVAFVLTGIKKTDGDFPSVKYQSIEFVREGAEWQPFIVWGTSGAKRGFDQVRAYQSFPPIELFGCLYWVPPFYCQYHTLHSCH